MTRQQMIKDIATVHYFIKTTIYNEFISDETQYVEKIRNAYKDISIDEIKDSLEDLKYLAVGAIKLNMREKIEANCIAKKEKLYEEYLNKCKALELEMETELAKNKELTNLTVDSLFSYINDK